MSKREFWFLLSVCFIFFLLRLPSLIEPYWYGDEGIYQVIGSALREGRILYQGIWDNKPPLLYVVYMLFGPEQFTVRFASLVSGLGSIIMLFLLTKKLFKSSTKQFYISMFVISIFALLFSTPFIEGNIANAENFMLLFIIAAAYLMLSHYYFIAGVLLGTSFLFKFVSVFDFCAFVIFIFISHRFVKTKKLFAFFRISLGFILPFGITIGYFLIVNAVGVFFDATLFQNVGYVGYKNKFIIGQGLLFAKSALLSGGIIFLAINRKRLPDEIIFIILWVLFSLFNAFFSQRPYTHYVLVLLPSLSLLAGIALFMKNGKKIFTAIFCVVVTVTVLQFNLHSPQKTILYYQNFTDFLTGKSNVSSYLRFFDSDTPRDYRIAYYLKLHANKQDGVFIWGNSAQIYTLSDKLPPGKYTVAYHIGTNQAREETSHALQRGKPKFIVVMQGGDFPFYLSDYKEIMIIQDATLYERIL